MCILCLQKNNNNKTAFFFKEWGGGPGRPARKGLAPDKGVSQGVSHRFDNFFCSLTLEALKTQEENQKKK